MAETESKDPVQANEANRKPSGDDVSQSPSDQSPSSSTTKKQRAWLAGSLAFIALVGAGASGFYGWQWQQQQTSEVADLRGQLSALQQSRQSSEQGLQSLNQRVSAALAAQANNQQAVDRRLQQQAKRILSLSSTSREDWQLAEAEYLLRLASQRLLMERSAEGSLALMQAADQILLQLDDMDLFAVREKIARDITALKLAAQVDEIGLYLQLNALAQQIDQLPLLPNQLAESGVEVEVAAEAPVVASSVETLAWGERLKQNFSRAFNNFTEEYIKVRKHDQPPSQMLPIDGGLYLQQNIRFSIERAQLALLRQEQRIYSDSLRQAATLLSQYYATQEQARAIATELTVLAEQAIVTELPSINGSLTALRSYTERLHKLEVRTPSPQVEVDAGSVANTGSETNAQTKD